MTEPIYVSESKIKGRGVYAKRKINKGEKICEMRGERIGVKDLYKTSQSGRNIVVDPLQVSSNEYINMIEPYVLINHSCDPCAGLNGTTLFAIRDIGGGEEITYDYSSTWFDGFNCNCESKNCRKHIGDFLGIPDKQRKKYLKLGIIPDFIKKSLI